MENSKMVKKTLGRRRIEMKKIEKKSTLSVTFSKRRSGLFKKASELSVLCGSDIAILVQSPAQKMFAFGSHSSVDSTLHRFTNNNNNNSDHHYHQINQRMQFYGDNSFMNNRCTEYTEAVNKLEQEKKVAANDNQEKEGEEGLWFEKSIEGMGISELEDYLDGLKGLSDNVQRRLVQMNHGESQKNIIHHDQESYNSTTASIIDHAHRSDDNHEMKKSQEITEVNMDHHHHYHLPGGSSSLSSLTARDDNLLQGTEDHKESTDLDSFIDSLINFDADAFDFSELF